MRRLSIVLVASIVLASTAHAQIGRVQPRPKSLTWVSASVGVMELSDIQDGSTNSEWLFGNTVQYRLSLELPIENQSTFGISGAFARVPLRYQSLGIVNPGCSFSCDADATVTQLMATFHAGRTALGFHQIIDISLGAVGYSGFRARASGERLPPRQLDPDRPVASAMDSGTRCRPTCRSPSYRKAFSPCTSGRASTTARIPLDGSLF